MIASHRQPCRADQQRDDRRPRLGRRPGVRRRGRDPPVLPHWPIGNGRRPSHLNRDVPPFVTVDGLSSHVVGLNMVGLRRNGFREADVLQLKAAYRVIYRSGLACNKCWRRCSKISLQVRRRPSTNFSASLAGGSCKQAAVRDEVRSGSSTMRRQTKPRRRCGTRSSGIREDHSCQR